MHHLSERLATYQRVWIYIGIFKYPDRQGFGIAWIRIWIPVDILEGQNHQFFGHELANWRGHTCNSAEKKAFPVGAASLALSTISFSASCCHFLHTRCSRKHQKIDDKPLSGPLRRPPEAAGGAKRGSRSSKRGSGKRKR